MPRQTQTGNPAPCAEVDLTDGVQHGYVVYKDEHGPLQYLLMPSNKVTGIEDPQILASSSPNYFAEAWHARRFMENRLGRPIDREDIALSINSSKGRSQNQLHIHISCIRPALKRQLAAEAKQIGNRWQALPGGLNGHPYLVRRLESPSLDQFDLFKNIAETIPDARQQMGNYTLAVVGARFNGQPGFYLLADRADLLHGNLASSEGDVQDHGCQVLTPASGSQGNSTT